MSKSISIEPKSKTGHIILGLILLIASIVLAIQFSNYGAGVFGYLIAGLFLVGSISEFVKASKN